MDESSFHLFLLSALYNYKHLTTSDLSIMRPVESSSGKPIWWVEQTFWISLIPWLVITPVQERGPGK